MRRGLAIALLLAAAPCAAQSPDPTRAELPQHGLGGQFVYDGEAVADLSGGAQTGALYHGSAQLLLSADLERLFGWNGTTAFVYAVGLHGRDPETLTGAAQGVSSITGPSGLRLDEAWLQHNFDGARFSLLAGLYDSNSEFYRLRSAALFLNSSFGMGPELSQSGPAGPSVFPQTSLALRAQFKATPEWLVRAAVADARPARGDLATPPPSGGAGAALLGEVAFLNRPGDPEPRSRRVRTGRFAGLAPYQDKYAVGFWHYTATFADLSAQDAAGNPVLRHGSSGAYALFDRLLTSADSPHKTSAFVQLGAGDPRVNRFAAYVGAGADISGVLPGRPDDELGFALAVARNGGQYMDSQSLLGTPATRHETILEATYLVQVSKRAALQPDLQYIVHPNTDPSVKNALVFMLRFEVSI